MLVASAISISEAVDRTYGDLVEDEIIFRRLVFNQQPVLEAAAAAGLHAHAESSLRGIDPLLLHELLDLNRRARGDDDRKLGLVHRAHCASSEAAFLGRR